MSPREMKKPSTGDPLSVSFEMHASCGLLGELQPLMKWEPGAGLAVRSILPPQPSPGGMWGGRGAAQALERLWPVSPARSLAPATAVILAVT